MDFIALTHAFFPALQLQDAPTHPLPHPATPLADAQQAPADLEVAPSIWWAFVDSMRCYA